MPREIQDGEGTTWSCIQAYAGLSNNAEKREAARVEGAPDLVEVVCTPSGGAQTVRLQFRSTTDASVTTSFRVDNASLK
jgi:hypothetical protein